MKITKQRLKQIIKEELTAAMSAGDPDGDGDDAAELRDMADQLEGGGKHVFVLSKPGDPVWGIFSTVAKVEEFLKGEGEAPDYPYVKYVLDPLVGDPDTDRESSAQEWRRIKRFTSDIRRLVNRALTSPPQRTPPPEPEDALENAIELTKMAAEEEFAPLVDKAAEEYKKSVAWEKILADFE